MNTGFSSQKTAFVLASTALILLFAVSAAPIPLYHRYAEAVGLSSGDLSMTAVAYFSGTVLTLLSGGRLSDHLGRKPVGALALLLGAASCFCFYRVQSLTPILLGRLLQGIACGLASSALAAYVTDNVTKARQALATVIVGGGPNLGLTVGAFASASLAAGQGSLFTVFIGLVAATLILTASLVFARETVAPKAGALLSMRPQISVPPQIKGRLPAAACIFMVAWVWGGFFQVFSASCGQALGSDNTLMAAGIFSAFLLAYFFGTFWAGSRPAKAVQGYGITVLVLGSGLFCLSLYLQAAALFFPATIGIGLAAGAAFNGAMRELIDLATPAQRAGVFSAIFLIAYCGAGLPNLFIANFAPHTPLLTIVNGYLILTVLFATARFILKRKTA